MKTSPIFIAAALSVAATPFALADEDVVELEDMTIVLDSVERDAVIDYFSFEDLNENQVNDMEDLVRMMPGISISKGDDRWGSSGFNIRGLDEDRVAINVDGVTQGETLKYEGGQAYGYFKGGRNGVDIEALKSVEIVKGADSILSGSGALAGAVNFTTKDAADFLAADGDDIYFGLKTSHAGVNDELMGSATFANRVGSLETLVIYTRRDSNEYENYDMDGADIEGSTREVPDPQEVTTDSLLAKVNYLLSDRQNVEFVYSSYERISVTNAMSYNGGWYNDRVGNDTSETNRIGLSYLVESENGMFDTMEASYNRQTVDFEAQTAQHVAIVILPYYNLDEDRVDVRSYDQEMDQLSVDFTKEFGGDQISHSLLYGFDYLDRDYENTQFRLKNSRTDDVDEWSESNLGSLVPAADSQAYTLYAMDSIGFGDSSRLRLGARLDDITYNAYANENYGDDTETLGESTFSTFSWAVGYEQDLNETLTASVGLSTGFRAPTIEERYSGTGSGEVTDWSTVANPDLKEETSLNLDMAISGNNAFGSFRLGYFNSQYEDFVESKSFKYGDEGYIENPNYVAPPVTEDNPNPPEHDEYSMPYNYGEVEISGFEFSSFLDLSEAFGMAQSGYGASFRAAYTDGEAIDPETGEETPLLSIQPWSASLGLHYTSAERVWGSNLLLTYTDERNRETDSEGNVIPTFPSDSSSVVDLTFFYNVNESLRLSAGVYNLFDEAYYTWDSIRFIDQGDNRPGIGVDDEGRGLLRYSEPGRNVKLSMSYSF